MKKQHDPNKHPRYPKGTVINGVNVGGKFMPKDGKRAAIGRNKPVRAIAAKLAQKTGIKATTANRRLMNAVKRALSDHRANGGDDDQKTLRRVAMKAIADEVRAIAGGRKGATSKKKPAPTKKSKPKREPRQTRGDNLDQLLKDLNPSDHKQLEKVGQVMADRYIKPIPPSKKEQALLKEKQRLGQEFLSEVQAYEQMAFKFYSKPDSGITAKQLAEKGRERDKLKKALEKINKASEKLEAGRASKEEKQHSELIEAIKQKHGLPGFYVKTLVDSIKYDSSMSPDKLATIKATMADFYELTGAKGSTSIREITYVADRAFASKMFGRINTGASPDRETIAHEAAHHLEFVNPEFRKAAESWRNSNALYLKPEKLSKLTGNKQYGDDELAYPGRYVDPYVGKVYQNGDTEVISVGVQLFFDPAKLKRFRDKSPSHFHLVLGMLLANGN